MLFRAKTIPAALIALLSVGAVATAAVAKSDNDTVVAIVDGAKITKKEVDAAMAGLPQLEGADAQQVFPHILEQMVTDRLIAGATKKAKVEGSDEYKQRLEAMKEQLARQIYVENYLKSKITDSAVKSEYEAFRKENEGKEEIRARQILLSTEDEANKALKLLKDGEKFEDVAKKVLTGPAAEAGGEIPGFFIKEEMIPEIGDAAFSLAAGKYTEKAIKSQFGWHVLKVEEKRKRSVPELKEVEGAIRNKIGQTAVADLTKELREKAKVELFNMDGKPLEEPKKN